MRRWVMVSVGVVAVIAVIGIIAVILFGRGVPKDDPQPQPTATGDVETSSLSFPRLTGTNLSLNELEVPADLAAGLKLIVVSYEAAQQPDVDSWLPPLETLNNDFPALSGYYIPLLPKSAADSAAFIIGGMSMAASNNTDRARTIVVFTDVEAFNELVAVADTSSIQLFLIDGENRIVWQAAGAYEEAKMQSLRGVLENLAV